MTPPGAAAGGRSNGEASEPDLKNGAGRGTGTVSASAGCRQSTSAVAVAVDHLDVRLTLFSALGPYP
jgi:hypothetical protein